MSDLELLPHIYAPLQLMFAEHCVELELKAAQRARQKEKRPLSPNLPTSGAIRNYSTDKKQDAIENNGTVDNMVIDEQKGEGFTNNDSSNSS